MAPFLILLLKQALSQRCSLKHARTTHNEFVVQTNHCQSPAAHRSHFQTKQLCVGQCGE